MESISGQSPLVGLITTTKITTKLYKIQLDKVAPACHPCAGKPEAEGAQTWGQPGLHSDFQVSLDYVIRPCLKKNQCLCLRNTALCGITCHLPSARLSQILMAGAGFWTSIYSTSLLKTLNTVCAERVSAELIHWLYYTVSTHAQQAELPCAKYKTLHFTYQRKVS